MTPQEVVPDLDPVNPLGRLIIRLEREGLLEPINRICKEHAVLIEEVFGETRRTHIARARRMVCWWLRDEKAWSYRAIGDLFGMDASGARSAVATAGRELGLAEYEAHSSQRGRAA